MRALSLFRAANAAKRKMRKERDQLREWQERASTRQRINDRCPACGHMTLFVSDAGYLTCSFLGCKEPGVMRAVKMIEAERDAAIADARILAQNWNGVMTSAELEAIVKKYLGITRATGQGRAQPALPLTFPECPECGMTHAPGGNTLCSQ